MDADIIPHRGRVFHFYWPYTRYMVTNLCLAGFWFLFKVLNRTTVIGKENVGEGMNTLSSRIRSSPGSPTTGGASPSLKARTKVIPVCIDGMDRVLPVGRVLPRIFNTVFVYYGPAVDLSEFDGVPATRETAQAAIDKVFASIRRQQQMLARCRRYRERRLRKAS